MRLVALLVLVFGVVLAGGAIFFASEKFRAVEAALARRNTGPDTVGVIVAGESLTYGNELIKSHVRIVQWPRGAVPDGAFTSLDDLFGSAESDPRFILRAIDKGEPILETKLSGFGERPRVVSTLSPGMRAFSIRIDAVSGVSGFIAPGDSVDILLTRSIGREMTSQVVLQNVVVIAVDQQADTEARSPRLGRTATVEVTPSDATTLATAQQLGKLTLLLRGMGETDATEVVPVRASDLSIDGPPEEVVPDNTTSIRVRRGTELQGTETFKEDAQPTPTEPQ